MPIVAQFMFGAQFKEDGIVEILRDEIAECGCVSLQSGAERFKVSVDHVRSLCDRSNGVLREHEEACGW
jgi:hypothetical protein